MAGARSLIPHRTLLVGPGPRATGLLPLLRALLTPDSPVTVRALTDVDGLLGRLSTAGCAVLDADEIPTEDLGIVTRFLARRPGWRAVLTGNDSRVAAYARFASHPRVRWIAWPLDVEHLTALVAPPEIEGADEATPGELPWFEEEEDEPAAETPTVPPPEALAGEVDAPMSTERELEEIARILGDDDEDDSGEDPADSGNESAPARSDDPAEADELDDLDDDRPPPAFDVAGPGFSLTPEEIAAFTAFDEPEGKLSPASPADDPAPLPVAPSHDDPFASVEPEELVGDGTTAGALETALPPGYFRDQVADLKDVAQRLELSLRALGEGVAGPDAERVALVRAEVSRLVQFTNTLGYIASPPAGGHQRIALSTLVQELLASAATDEDDGPRILFRNGTDDLYVRSDKLLLVQAFDALLALARSCSSNGDVVRVSTADAAPGSMHTPAVELVITFPNGPLGTLDPQEIVTPYALRRVVPEIGANALFAAQSILMGQGGTLELSRPEPGRLRWRAVLPVVP